MNGYDEKRHLDDDAFGAKGGIVSAFDAFPKAKPQYVQHTSSGGKWTVAMIVISAVLFWTELARWWRGEEQHTFAVEKAVSHVLPINLDIVVRMRCADLHVNVQDAAGDRILAAGALTRDGTLWSHWVDGHGVHRLGRDAQGRVVTGEGTVNTAPGHFHKFQYYLSVVPTTYSVGHPGDRGSSALFTNQYAVTEQSGAVAENMVPGIFVKYDIEPILLSIVETRDSFFVFLIKVVNVVSGVLVAGHWGYRMTDWAKEVLGRRRRGHSEGMLGRKGDHSEE
ncbi:hypothetical protein CHGG_07057 [Chaetomium globosum CBS 148.51]|uniref:Endoplasmic reticulum-Golgi intermediate compartment protein n=1 Tax=Chaetomium globosum (strain ATCC 6205 / CBS 148.51 / DSM 1962 / NBRC 6347 / NRRL 1970) TaxID=306901 RepID=Q2GY97_CHAGB|nr:uncharacterized protein CHGG_07057 [Chaetomium globosum CBS 148.51]EAQ85804.1 hypothetical protein CHGG_07057 [Chaetomium globosum CBS 148.51]